MTTHKTRTVSKQIIRDNFSCCALGPRRCQPKNHRSIFFNQIDHASLAFKYRPLLKMAQKSMTHKLVSEVLRVAESSTLLRKIGRTNPANLENCSEGGHNLMVSEVQAMPAVKSITTLEHVP